jgi:hypothetical protein
VLNNYRLSFIFFLLLTTKLLILSFPLLLAIKSGQKSLAGRNSPTLEDVITFGVYLVKNTLLSRSPCRVTFGHHGKRPA